MMDRGNARNVWRFLTKYIWEINASVGWIKKHIYSYTVQNYITNAPTCFGASAPSSGSLYTVFAKVIKY